MSEQQDPYNPEDTETEPDDQGPGTGETVKEEGGFVSPHQTESAHHERGLRQVDDLLEGPAGVTHRVRPSHPTESQMCGRSPEREEQPAT